MATKPIKLPKDTQGKEYYPATTTEAVVDRKRVKPLNEIIDDIEIRETSTQPSITPNSNRILVDTANGFVYFGLTGRGWWKASIKRVDGSTEGGAIVTNSVLALENVASVDNNVLTINIGKVTNNTLEL